jgi:ubiquinone/menaquinone biosynthesis C-methylase UbiE|tara:strand:+ start:1145 stop:1813 length:669 start_codon:yes stop_codon:yes gene_type:complete
MKNKEIKLMTKNHNKTKRNYLKRMVNFKVACMIEAKKYEKNYWDGPRKFGYGGYKYIPGRFVSVAKKLIKKFNLKNASSILDVGCGKGFILYEIKKILPNINIVGFDISKHAIKDAPAEIKNDLFIHKAQIRYPFKKNKFDLAISTGCFHNLEINDLKFALQEIQRVSKQTYVMVESYRNEKELFNLQCWALTCESFFSNQEWKWLFKEFKYNKNYEFIYFS